MRLTDAQLQAITDACIEAEAGELDGWADDIAKALPQAIEKLKTEYWRRQELRPHPRRKGGA